MSEVSSWIDTSLAYKMKIFIQKETSENEKGVIRPEFDRWEWEWGGWSLVKVILGYGEVKHYLHKQHRLCSGISENDQLMSHTGKVSSPFKYRNQNLVKKLSWVPFPTDIPLWCLCLDAIMGARAGPRLMQTTQRSNPITVTLCPKESSLLTQCQTDSMYLACPVGLCLSIKFSGISDFVPFH